MFAGSSITRLRAAVAAALALTLLLTACADDEPAADAPASEAPATSVPNDDVPPASEPPAQSAARLRLWLSLEDFTGLTVRQGQVTGAQFGRASLTELFEGPAGSEAALGWGTAIPAGTELLGLSISSGIATVDLSDEFESGGGSLSVRLRLAQLVYTLTEFDTVDGVILRIEGDDVDTFSSEGLVLDQPMTRADFEDLVAPIVVLAPFAGQEISSPVEVRGTANVFEANVSMRIVDEDGNELASDFATATCGTGCRGTYQKKISFQVDQAQNGFVEVFESSAEDGSPLHMVRVPVLLVP